MMGLILFTKGVSLLLILTFAVSAISTTVYQLIFQVQTDDLDVKTKEGKRVVAGMSFLVLIIIIVLLVVSYTLIKL